MNNLHTVRHTPEQDLRTEIAWYEARLRELGASGECAYEKALTRSFEQALDAKCARLASLHGGCALRAAD